MAQQTASGYRSEPQPRAWWALPALVGRPRLALGLMVAGYAALLFFGLTYKYYSWGQGYDQIDYEQSIWNTTQGRFLEISHYRHTDHLWGMDFIPAILLLVPFYALFPSALTLHFFQALFMGLGALPVYAVARDRFGGSAAAGLAWAAVYLLYPSVWFVTMSAPWQPRTLAVPALLGAFYFLQRAKLAASSTPGQHAARLLLGFLGCLVVALTTRTDVSLVVAAFGLLAAVWRMGWRWALPPLVLGLAWFYLATNVVTPAFYHEDYQPRTGSTEDYSETWPGTSPQLAYYPHLGRSLGEILMTIVTRPLYVAQIVFTGPKITYVLLMLLPLALLPLLAPEVMLLAAPPLAMNLLSLRPFQITVREQYQALVIPGLVLAAIVGGARLWAWWRARSARAGDSADGREPPQLLAGLRSPAALLLGLVLFAAAVNLAYRNPVITTVRYREDPARIAAMERMAALVPPDAPLGATSFLAPRMMPRRYLYYVPPDESFPPLESAEYLFIDTRASALHTERGREFFEQLRASDRWETLREEQGLLLLRRVDP
nr:MAG: hypothetical protein DIU80_04635 [Chloroflexota bacterium]